MDDDEKAERCPYCGGELIAGRIFSDGGHAAWWLPDRAEPGTFVTEKSIEKRGGFLLGKATKVGLFAAERPVSLHCANCEILITKLGKG